MAQLPSLIPTLMASSTTASQEEAARAQLPIDIETNALRQSLAFSVPTERSAAEVSRAYVAASQSK